MSDSRHPYNGQDAPIPVPDLENWNTDRAVDVPVMVRGMMYKNGGAWYMWDGSVTSGLNIAAYDYVGVGYPTSTSETFTFKTGGSSGTTVATVTLVYTDATKADLSSVTKT